VVRTGPDWSSSRPGLRSAGCGRLHPTCPQRSGPSTLSRPSPLGFALGMTEAREVPDEGRPSAAVDLYWIPLGAGHHVVRLSGRLFEAISARVQRRPPCDLYHSALVVIAPEGRFVIEQTPILDMLGERRGVVLEGPVGSRLAGCFRLFRYEVRRWRDGVIPDIAEAVSSPVRVTDDPAQASLILDLVPSVPALVWGRDEGHAGDMWNSNSVISWLIANAGLDPGGIQPPSGGRAPGWRAGLEIAARDATPAHLRSRRTAMVASVDPRFPDRGLRASAAALRPRADLSTSAPTRTCSAAKSGFGTPRRLRSARARSIPQ
jgi:hypothetical protein